MKRSEIRLPEPNETRKIRTGIPGASFALWVALLGMVALAIWVLVRR